MLHNQADEARDSEGMDAISVEQRDGLPGDESGLTRGQEVQEAPTEEAGHQVQGQDTEERLGGQKDQGYIKAGQLRTFGNKNKWKGVNFPTSNSYSSLDLTNDRNGNGIAGNFELPNKLLEQSQIDVTGSCSIAVHVRGQ